MIAECGSSKMQSQDIWAYDFTNYQYKACPSGLEILYKFDNLNIQNEKLHQ